MIRIKDLNLVCSREELRTIPAGKVMINTINAFSYNTARKDALFQEALLHGDYLIPDGAGIVKACHWLNAKCQPKERVTGWDLFSFEMSHLAEKGNPEKLETAALLHETSEATETFETTRRPIVMFMGSSEKVLELIRQKAAVAYPDLEIVTYSPPYKREFSDEDDKAMIKAVNEANPDLLWIGMTAPKQEKWTYSHWDELDIHCHVGTVGAVFDFFAGTYRRAPLWWQEHSLEWLYRLMKEPKRMWRRYIIGNTVFLIHIFSEKIGME